MSLNKAVIMGNVVRNPEKRFTTNNLAITAFTINISNKDQESLIRVVTKGKLAEVAAETVKKDKTVIVEGRLQTSVTKTNTGTEKKGVELDAISVVVVGEGPSQKAGSEVENTESLNYDDEISSDDLIGEDEIPF